MFIFRLLIYVFFSIFSAVEAGPVINIPAKVTTQDDKDQPPNSASECVTDSAADNNSVTSYESANESGVSSALSPEVSDVTQCVKDLHLHDHIPKLMDNHYPAHPSSIPPSTLSPPDDYHHPPGLVHQPMSYHGMPPVYHQHYGYLNPFYLQPHDTPHMANHHARGQPHSLSSSEYSSGCSPACLECQDHVPSPSGDSYQESGISSRLSDEEPELQHAFSAAASMDRPFGWDQPGLLPTPNLPAQQPVVGSPPQQHTTLPHHPLVADNDPDRSILAHGKVFVGALSQDTTPQRLAEYFSSFFGPITQCIIKLDDDGRSRGFGFLFFSDYYQAWRVLKNGPYEVSSPLVLDGRISSPSVH